MLFYSPEIEDGNHSLSEEELRHAVKVLRLKAGDPLKITDGKGKIFNAKVTKISKSACDFEIINSITVPKKNHSIHIGVAPTKNIDRIEWFVEKVTELGVDEISFVHSQNSERKVINLERIQKKAISAMKQSGQAWLPLIHPIQPLKNIYSVRQSNKFIAYVDQANPMHLKEAKPNGQYIVLIGPEGDFTQEELAFTTNHGYQKVSLGKTTLRTETAGVVACHILNLINE